MFSDVNDVTPSDVMRPLKLERFGIMRNEIEYNGNS